MTSLVFAVAVAFQTLNPDQLPIGAKGLVSVEPGQIVETKTGKVVTSLDVARAALGSKFLFLGENHATTAHQALQAQLITDLVSLKANPAVGVEMFTRPKQDVLDLWSTGTMNEADFLKNSDWKGQWGYDYGFYRPVFEAVKNNKLPLIALNVPRDWVRRVGKGGFGVLPLSAKLQLPANPDLTNKNHKMVFESLMGGHQMGAGPSIENMYAAQVLWDIGMADTAAKYLEVTPQKPGDIFVVIAGSGHVMYGQGINYRLEKRKAGKGITVVMMQSDKTAQVSKGIGDYVFVSKPEPKPAPK